MKAAGRRRAGRAAWWVVAGLAGLSAAACGVPGEGAGEPAPPGPGTLAGAVELGEAPWSSPAVPAAEVPEPYMDAWRAAENRETCALLAFDDPPRGDQADVRTARFAGGWGVAYDLPDLRSAFGVAGTGVRPGPDTYDEWPYRVEWDDGSRAGYGPEGGGGSNQLAYLEVSGEDCLYNVWSRIGREHLEALLAELRRIDYR
jgi:hypothetical protein